MFARPLTIPERILVLEEQAAACADARKDVENRLRKIERTIQVGLGGLAVLQLTLKFLP